MVGKISSIEHLTPVTRGNANRRSEKLSDVGKVVSSPEGNLELTVQGNKEPLRIEAGLFDMEQLGSFFSLLGEVHQRAMREAEEAREEAERKRLREAERAAAAAEAEKERRLAAMEGEKRRKMDELRATVDEGCGGEGLVAEAWGSDCLIGLSQTAVAFACQGRSLQSSALPDIKSLRSSPEGSFTLVLAAETGEGILIPAGTFEMEELAKVFGAMKGFTEAAERARREEEGKLEEIRLAKVREEERKKEEERERQRQEEEERERKRKEAEEAEEAAKLAAVEALKQKREDAVRDDAKSEGQQVVALLHGPSCVVGASKTAVYFVGEDATMRKALLSDVEKVGMGKTGDSMVLIVKGEEFMELSMADYNMEALGDFFSKLQK